jgi:ATP-dependent DNA helicase RecG
MKLSDDITILKGVGPAQAKKFNALGIHTLEELVNYFPRTYEDYSDVRPIAKLEPGNVSFKATVKHAKGRYVRRRMHITEAIASDETSSVRLIWFNQPYRANAINEEKEYFVSGKFELGRGRFSLINPSLELASDMPANTARILSVYRESKGLNSREIRLAIAQLRPLLITIEETLPKWLIKNFKLISRAQALTALHLPESGEALEEARRRLGLEEVFELSLASLMNKQEIKTEKAMRVKFNETLAKTFVKNLPFKLTDNQRLSTWQIYKDMDETKPMNRLLEGDVGSGKTVVATMAALMVMDMKMQSAIMAPTELLARQHADTVYKLLKPLGFENKVCLLVGSMAKAEKDKAKESIKSGKASLIIGTHALIQEDVDMNKLALIVIDEQHRFGVDQRKKLMLKAGHMPHVLSLTATPIPRSLALTLYGELDISILREKPLGRKHIKTEIIRPTEADKLKQALNQEMDAGRQIFVVCPNISDSSLMEAKSVESVYEDLSKKQFKGRHIGLLHGKLKAQDKISVMQDFVDHKLDILVATTVIEVGVDVPNATVMLIESPERFGLAQLHQLRGRVGRGEHQGYFFLHLDGEEHPSPRLRALVSSSDGFKLAEMDLDIRGPGAIYGTSQHGLLDLRIAKLSDIQLIKQAIKAAQEFIDKQEDLLKYKELNSRVKKLRVVTNLN